MSTEITADGDVEHAITELYRDLAQLHLSPLWTQAADLMTSEPRPKTVPWMWRWRDLLPAAQRAGELITIERGGDRRVLSLANPGLSGRPFATSTLWGAVQYLNPGEHAPAHRHSPGAIRFVVQGSGVYTTVNGDACEMGRGDLILTPGWAWHDHNSDSDEPMVWFDGLDLPTVSALDSIFFEEYPDELLQPVRSRNGSRRSFNGAGLVPADLVGQTPQAHSPLLIYRWAETDAALTALLEERGGPMATLEYCDPTTGLPVLPTMGCRMHRILAADRTPTVQRTGSSIFVVLSGSGETVIAGERFSWGPGDMFVVPSWAPVDFRAEVEADLFSVNDVPTLRSLRLYREQTWDESQDVLADFDDATPAMERDPL